MFIIVLNDPYCSFSFSQFEDSVYCQNVCLTICLSKSDLADTTQLVSAHSKTLYITNMTMDPVRSVFGMLKQCNNLNLVIIQLRHGPTTNTQQHVFIQFSRQEPYMGFQDDSNLPGLF
jgi:hypothetical protein